MKQRMDALLYPVADALQMQLEYTSTGVTGFATRQLEVGPFRLGMSIRANSCVLTAKQVTFQVHVRHNLHFYLVSEPNRLRLIMFDGIAAGMRNRTDSLGTDPERIAKALKGAAKVYLLYHQASEKWSETDAFDLV